jgi:hypothetical protein
VTITHLAQVLPAVAASLGVALPEARDRSLPDASSAVVVLVDGLGFDNLERSAADAPYLSAQSRTRISAGFPTTTPAGLGALGTGLPPGGHGLVAASFWLPETGEMMHPLRWGAEPADYVVSPERTVFERAATAGVSVHAVSPRAYRESGLTRSVLRGAQYRGADGVGERLVETLDAARGEGRNLTYVYWGELDRTGHVHGWESEHWRQELRTVDGFIERLRDLLPAGVAMYVTADHGMVDCATRIDIDTPTLTDGVARLGGEPRCRQVYTRAGATADVVARWTETLRGHARVMTRAEACRALYAGPVQYEDRIGDVIAVATDDVVLASDRTDRLISSLKGHHGADSDAETFIPLLTITR